MKRTLFGTPFSVVVLCSALIAPAAGQQPPAPQPQNTNGAVPTGVTPPPGYVIGPEDVLTIFFWRDKELSAEVMVRPDGRISLPLLNDVDATNRTPEQLRAEIEKAASKFIADPNATVVVKQINSRKVFIMGQVGKAGAFPLIGEMTVVQLIAQAGGFLEYADDKKIVITRTESGRSHRFLFNYRDFVAGKNVEQNIALKPGDTVIVP